MVQRIDLTKRFPISFRFLLLESSLWGMGSVMLTAIAWWFRSRAIWATDDASYLVAHLAAGAFALIGLCLFAVFLMRLAKAALFRARFRLVLDGDHLIFTQGILSRESDSILLERITDILIGHSPSELALGLAHLSVHLPTSKAIRYSEIPGLDAKHAKRLQTFLLNAIKEQSKPVYSLAA